MFYQMITNARNCWLASSDCVIKNLIAYIETTGQMRDAQIDAIKTYLFLKIGCGCLPLSRLFQEGRFNNIGSTDSRAFCGVQGVSGRSSWGGRLAGIRLSKK